jgi:hypothetical protein
VPHEAIVEEIIEGLRARLQAAPPAEGAQP